MAKEVKMASGKMLEISIAPFAEAQDLYMAVAEEMKALKINPENGMDEFYKNIACIALSSRKILGCINACLKSCLYNEIRITPETWEPEEARGDYIRVLIEVCKANIDPFVKSLYAEYKVILAALKGSVQA